MKPLNFRKFVFLGLFLGLLTSCGVRQDFNADLPQNDSELMGTTNRCNDLIPKVDHHKITTALLEALNSTDVKIYSGSAGFIATLVVGQCILYAVFDKDGQIVTHYFVSQMHYVKSKITGMSKLSGKALSTALGAIAKSLSALPVMPIFIIPDLKCDESPRNQPLPFLCWNFDEYVPA
ncbi:MAG: hypothetical protein KBD78_04425 [Oligoflexales bacterium]|nr:hypothetical protein [Oligoflexales bacterium]